MTARAAIAGLAILLLHVPPVTLLFLPMSPVQWLGFAAGYGLVLFSLGAGLHRYFSHRAFRTSRAFQLLLALMAAMWFGDAIGFAGRHRHHHRWSDTARDRLGPRHGFFAAWFGHLIADETTEEELADATRDLWRYPELRWLHRWTWAPGALTIGAIWVAGGWTMMAAAYCLPWCLVAIHGGSAVNYVCHRSGRRRYATGDGSTNHALLGYALFGEGWHNNHHRYPGAARAGLAWWELDVLYLMLRALDALGLVWDLRDVPAERSSLSAHTAVASHDRRTTGIDPSSAREAGTRSPGWT